MKFFIAIAISLTSLSGFSSEIPEIAKTACTERFEKGIFKIYEGTSAETVRRSSRVTYKTFEAKNEKNILLEISANFYVKWPRNSGEVKELAGGNFVFDQSKGSCKSVLYVDFVKLKK